MKKTTEKNKKSISINKIINQQDHVFRGDPYAGPFYREKVSKLTKINWEHVDFLCSIACTQKEICAFLGISHDTFSRVCKKEHKMTGKEYIQSKLYLGDISLRRAQWISAVKLYDSSMLKHLGKNRLGQVDKVIQEHTGPDGGPISYQNYSEMTDEELDQQIDMISKQTKKNKN